MISRSHGRPRAGKARRAQWLAVLCATVLSFFAPRARAAAPLCDPSGASVPAPIPVLPNATGDLAPPKSCDDATRSLTGVPRRGNDAPAAERGFDVPDRVTTVPLAFPKVASTRVPEPGASTTPSLPGHSLPVYRPPRG